MSKKSSVIGRIGGVKNSILRAPQIRMLSPNVLSQMPQNVAVQLSIDALAWGTNSRCTIPRMPRKTISMLLAQHTRDFKNTNFPTCEVSTAVSLGNTGTWRPLRALTERTTLCCHRLMHHRTIPEAFWYHLVYFIICDVNFILETSKYAHMR